MPFISLQDVLSIEDEDAKLQYLQDSDLTEDEIEALMSYIEEEYFV